MLCCQRLRMPCVRCLLGQAGMLGAVLRVMLSAMHRKLPCHHHACLLRMLQICFARRLVHALCKRHVQRRCMLRLLRRCMPLCHH